MPPHSPGPRRWRPRRAVVVAFVLGVVSVYGAEYVINNTDLADRAIGPLLTADTSGPADAIVVLGAGISGDCSTNLNAMRRSLLAARLYKEGRAGAVLFTGGRPPGLPCTIAEVMAAAAKEAGVPADRIFLESRSRSTRENAVDAGEILHALRARRILLVTDRLHMPRAEGSFRTEGFAIERASVPVSEGSVDNVNMLKQGLREYVALAIYRARGFIAEPAVHPATDSEVSDTMTPAPTSPSGPLVILGASYARSWPLRDAAGLPVVNTGIDGQQSSEMLGRFDRDVIAAQPRAVLLWGFINDVFRSPRDRVAATTDQAVQNFTEMIQRARVAGIEPIVATEITVRPSDRLVERLKVIAGGLLGKQGYAQYINSHVRATNERLRALAQRERLLLLDFERALADRHGSRRPEFVDPDGSHVSPAGYAELTAYADPLFRAHFAARR